MRIVNLAHGNIYAFGAYVTAWVTGSMVAGASLPVWLILLPVGAVATALLGAILEPTLLRPFYKRAEEYQLLCTFGLLMILEDVMRFFWGPYPLSASALFEASAASRSGTRSIRPTTSSSSASAPPRPSSSGRSSIARSSASCCGRARRTCAWRRRSA